MCIRLRFAVIPVAKPWAANKEVVVWGTRDGRFPALNAGVVSTVFTLLSIALLLGFVIVQWSDLENQAPVALLLVVPILVGLIWTALTRFNLGFQVLHVRVSHAGVEVQYSFAPRLLANRQRDEALLDWTQVIHMAADTTQSEDGPDRHYAVVKLRPSTRIDGMRPRLRLYVATRSDAEGWVKAAKGFRQSSG